MIKRNILIAGFLINIISASQAVYAEEKSTIDIESKKSGRIFYNCTLLAEFYTCQGIPLKLKANDYIVIRDESVNKKSQKIPVYGTASTIDPPSGDIPVYGHAFDE